jgi:hypothetical protein
MVFFFFHILEVAAEFLCSKQRVLRLEKLFRRLFMNLGAAGVDIHLLRVVCCVGSGFCGGLITYSEKSYRICVCVCVCVIRNLKNETA